MIRNTISQLGVNQTVVDVTNNVENYIVNTTNALGSRSFGLKYAMAFQPHSLQIAQYPVFQTLKGKSKVSFSRIVRFQHSSTTSVSTLQLFRLLSLTQ